MNSTPIPPAGPPTKPTPQPDSDPLVGTDPPVDTPPGPTFPKPIKK